MLWLYPLWWLYPDGDVLAGKGWLEAEGMMALVLVGGTIASFIQTRGSIPLIWHQRPDLRYKPPPTLELRQGVTHRDCFSRHFVEQVSLYGQQVIINLVDQKVILKTVMQ